MKKEIACLIIPHFTSVSSSCQFEEPHFPFLRPLSFVRPLISSHFLSHHAMKWTEKFEAAAAADASVNVATAAAVVNVAAAAPPTFDTRFIFRPRMMPRKTNSTR